MADKLNVLSICGSLRKGSFNAIVERALPGLAPEGMSITPAPPYDTFPIYNFDIQHAQGIPADVITLGNAILAADGVVIVSAEYNFSIPGGLEECDRLAVADERTVALRRQAFRDPVRDHRSGRRRADAISSAPGAERA